MLYHGIFLECPWQRFATWPDTRHPGNYPGPVQIKKSNKELFLPSFATEMYSNQVAFSPIRTNPSSEIPAAKLWDSEMPCLSNGIAQTIVVWYKNALVHRCSLA